MDEEDDIFEEMVKYLFDVSQTNNIFDNLLTESEIEEILNDLFDVLQPKSDKKDGDDESSLVQKRETVIVQIEAGRRLSGKSLWQTTRRLNNWLNYTLWIV